MSDEGLPLYRSWRLRLFPKDGFLPIGKAGELWHVRPAHPAQRWIENQPTGRGRGATYATRSLLPAVLHAAGGVELAARRIFAGIAETRRSAVHTGYEYELPLATSLQWEYPHLLIWLRTVAERIDRRNGRGSNEPSGLLSWIAEETLRADVRRARDEYERKGQHKWDRSFANYVLHAYAIPSPTDQLAVCRTDGTVFVPIPDPTKDEIHLFDQLTYETGRDLDTFANEALQAVDRLMNDLLAAFERANERVRPTRNPEAW